jgi:hypothetical protein
LPARFRGIALSIGTTVSRFDVPPGCISLQFAPDTTTVVVTVKMQNGDNIVLRDGRSLLLEPQTGTIEPQSIELSAASTIAMQVVMGVMA